MTAVQDMQKTKTYQQTVPKIMRRLLGLLALLVMLIAGDPSHFQPHVRNKPRRKALAKRFKNVNDPLKLVIVRLISPELKQGVLRRVLIK